MLATALGQDVMMPCQLSLSEKIVIPPVLYWVYLIEDIESTRLWEESDGKYKNRVNLLDHDKFSSNKSILLKNVQWDDSGKYLCKLSVSTETDGRFRAKGNKTFLMIHGKL